MRPTHELFDQVLAPALKATKPLRTHVPKAYQSRRHHNGEDWYKHIGRSSFIHLRVVAIVQVFR